MSLTKPPGAWALNYDKCVRCGKTDTKHMGKGLCRRCYFDDYNKANEPAIKAYKRKWYFKSGAAVWAKALREQQNYDGKREAALRRDGYKCVRCGNTRQLCVHHKDRRGRNVPPALKNNKLENLETICRRCHLNEHRAEQNRAGVGKRIWAARRANQRK